jgi:hypothetical protein
MPVYKYLDLSTAHVTEAEMDAINARFGDVDDETPRVIPHDYGAWVNVPEQQIVDEDSEFYAALAERYPNVAACLERARALECLWINFDQDASTHDGLPTYDW